MSPSFYSNTMMTNTWKCFRYDEIFQIRRGFYGKKPEAASHGDIPFIGATAFNNGVTSWHTLDEIEAASKDGSEKNQPLESKIFDGNCICVTNNGSVGCAYYQEAKFTCSSDVTPLYPNPNLGWKMNKYNALFLCGVIEQERFRWSYGRKWKSERMAKSVIKLPVTTDGKPDWQFMEDYVKRIFPSMPRTENASRDGSGTMMTNTWKCFRYDEIFQIRKGFYNKKPEAVPHGDIPFIGATDFNNGVTSWHTLDEIEVASKDGSEKNQPLESKIFDGNCICVTNNGSVGYAYYQEAKFTCSHDVNPLYPNPNLGWKMNKYNALFLCSVIEQERFRWAYGRKWRPERMAKSVIKLPVTTDGKPDWQFMEDCIKSLPMGDCL